MWHLISFLASINSTEYTDKNTAIYVSAMSSTRTDSEWLIVPPNFLNACSSLPTVSALKVNKGQFSSKTSTLSWELTSLPDFIWFIQHYESVCIRWSCHTGYHVWWHVTFSGPSQLCLCLRFGSTWFTEVSSWTPQQCFLWQLWQMTVTYVCSVNYLLLFQHFTT